MLRHEAFSGCWGLGELEPEMCWCVGMLPFRRVAEEQILENWPASNQGSPIISTFLPSIEDLPSTEYKVPRLKLKRG
jgi:hypothetical protein